MTREFWASSSPTTDTQSEPILIGAEYTLPNAIATGRPKFFITEDYIIEICIARGAIYERAGRGSSLRLGVGSASAGNYNTPDTPVGVTVCMSPDMCLNGMERRGNRKRQNESECVALERMRVVYLLQANASVSNE
ncbi:hypothetical protein EVAR_21994_1 [Eumeta japonica]|uniref:Uncharacterized protein n=1 Tax=Eumeta variegata TaxID=151549 RepID=A0A4C1VUB6_EUMVA|nr:hypothetical protein EVAR_21994_1 [Eumeta japonica]